MHVRAAHINLACPLLDVTTLAIDVVAVIRLHCLLSNIAAIVAGDVKHRLDYLGQNIFWIKGKQFDALTIVDRDARVGCPKVNANFESHVFASLSHLAGITPMDRINSPASIEPAPVIASAK